MDTTTKTSRRKKRERTYFPRWIYIFLLWCHGPLSQSLPRVSMLCSDCYSRIPQLNLGKWRQLNRMTIQRCINRSKVTVAPCHIKNHPKTVETIALTMCRGSCWECWATSDQKNKTLSPSTIRYNQSLSGWLTPISRGDHPNFKGSKRMDNRPKFRVPEFRARSKWPNERCKQQKLNTHLNTLCFVIENQVLIFSVFIIRSCKRWWSGFQYVQLHERLVETIYTG